MYIDWFKQFAKLKINSTLLRSLVETEMDNLRQQNIISQQQQTAIHNINGHSSETTKQYYILNNIKNDIAIGKQAFNQLFQSDNVNNSIISELSESTPVRLTPETTALVTPDMMGSQSTYDYSDLIHNEPMIPLNFSDVKDVNIYPSNLQAIDIEWGSAHPNYMDIKRCRAVWTEDEKSIIASWIDKRIYEMSPIKPGNLYRDCLEYIIKTKSLHKHFHAIHVQDSARLQQGHRQHKIDLIRKQAKALL
jgi:hypothetical protein